MRHEPAGGSVLYITHAFSADFLHLCRGHRNVGAVMFVYGDAVNDAEVGQQTARLLIEDPGWLAVGAITGLDERMTRNSQGTIEPTAALSAQFSVRTQTTLKIRS
ncbi:MAG: hypothetical protein GWN99_07190 [Gemmatimonadetes bacterium]|uniref:Uncharacterized protein n=1 Tax=Candidatus Kutchimonas denitrificans TaxID=3056748 RepID=A0AAE5CBD7_9BACT|nr:hypothetical protein [Gemmatimonadota bacterium]NIR74448.1 hypothetical protein [Candidatus Kutchimonas denitrificans]NIS00844.1 hypothetical protein [Gemmatimonadota bacterium]NIT66467.1 hypothetical protein [Gemmatimonadota bacterium]NIU52098.1 hypothetical protein [Gemmatimonadota bacterium]